MADNVTVASMPDSGSKEAIAYKLWEMLRTSANDVDEQLKLYARCLEATHRNGKYHNAAFK